MLFFTRRFIRLVCLGLVGLALAVAGGCATVESRKTTSVVDYLYPDAKEPVVDQGIPVLNLPMRIGVAFIPDAPGRGTEVLTEARKRALLEEVAQHFREHDFVRSIEIIPSAYLRPQGGFQNLEQIRTMYGIDVVALVSYDQTQFTDEGLSSLAYWTLIGAYIVRGEKNSTHTMVDAVIVDIPSRKMLFRAPGTSFVKGTATPVNLSARLREDAEQSFEEAVAEMILNLDRELVVFQDRVKHSPEEFQVVAAPDYRGGGAVVPKHALMLCLLLLAGWGWSARRG